jgi:hypothetical protein
MNFLTSPIDFNLVVHTTQIPAWEFAVIIVSAFAVAVVIGVFCLAMLIDCLKRNFAGQAKWLMIILFFNIFGAIAYYFNVKKGK